MSRRFDLPALGLWPEPSIPGAAEDTPRRPADWAEDRAWLRVMAPEALADDWDAPGALPPVFAEPPPLSPLAALGVGVLFSAAVATTLGLIVAAAGWWGLAGIFASVAGLWAWACRDVLTGEGA